MQERNPFRPSSGSTPPVLAGRAEILDELEQSLHEGPGALGRTTIFTGGRGVGKTVLLTEVEDIALRAGWLTISETATPGFLVKLEEQVDHLLEERRPRPKRIVTGAQVAGVGLTSSAVPEIASTLRRKVSALLDVLEHHGSGLLITLDEVHNAVRGEIRELAALSQHLTREDRQTAVVLAGLPAAVSGLLGDDVTTFLRRADRHDLKTVDEADVADAIERPLTDAGVRIEPEALDLAVDATGGYPFMIQLVGWELWRRRDDDAIDTTAARTAVGLARRRLGNLVHATALDDLSDVDRTFLLAMAKDDRPSRMADIITRLGPKVTPQYANVYRTRLLDAGMIRQAGRGRVDFALPYLREYLREHAASLLID
ncbi:ATP-binding protein [Aeromicrobium sp. 179-A 4D2 NHS]|uniref:ATP-binding protein n=1 Tax=Aeromicrobium sp. 179-A 4D2 NHS TaxID=3142375 RepID=UPI0039A0BD12